MTGQETDFCWDKEHIPLSSGLVKVKFQDTSWFQSPKGHLLEPRYKFEARCTLPNWEKRKKNLLYILSIYATQ